VFPAKLERALRAASFKAFAVGVAKDSLVTVSECLAAGIEELEKP